MPHNDLPVEPELPVEGALQAEGPDEVRQVLQQVSLVPEQSSKKSS
jgi:hypothetical protein